jgi:hypothetical protein
MGLIVATNLDGKTIKLKKQFNMWLTSNMCFSNMPNPQIFHDPMSMQEPHAPFVMSVGLRTLFPFCGTYHSFVTCVNKVSELLPSSSLKDIFACHSISASYMYRVKPHDQALL